MNNKIYIIEILKSSILLLIFILVLLIYLKVNNISVSFGLLDNGINNINNQLSNTRNIENNIGENFSIANKKSEIRNAMLREIISIASISQQYYRKPKSMNGGNSSFNNFEMPLALQRSETAKYTIQIYDTDSLKIIGYGNEIGADGKNPIKIELQVLPNSIGLTKIIN